MFVDEEPTPKLYDFTSMLDELSRQALRRQEFGRRDNHNQEAENRARKQFLIRLIGSQKSFPDTLNKLRKYIDTEGIPTFDQEDYNNDA